MENEVTVATIQTHIFWENTTQNLTHLDDLIQKITTPFDLLVLPEMFNTGFSMNPQNIALPDGGEVLEWLLQNAKKHNACFVGSVATEVENQFFNRLYWVFPDGKVSTYDKRHLFRMANEQNTYQAGADKLIVTYKGLRFCPMVCYDLRFPVWSRRTQAADYDCLIYVANWPAARSEAWYSLLKARAIENLSYVVGVNRVGEDGNGYAYDGKSAVFNFKGAAIDTHEDNVSGVSFQVISKSQLAAFRTSFPADLDADKFLMGDG